MLDNGRLLLSMGGYGVYIWPCFILTLGCLGYQLITSIRVHMQVKTHYQ